MDVPYCKATKSLQHQSENKNISTSSSFFGIPCPLGRWCALNLGSYWERRKLMAVEMGWPGGGVFQPGFGIPGNLSKFFSDLCIEMYFS